MSGKNTSFKRVTTSGKKGREKGWKSELKIYSITSSLQISTTKL